MPCKAKTIRRNEVEIRVICEPEEIAIRGNCSAIDDDTDRETEQWIRGQLDSGNEWAWCCVTVEAHYGPFVGRDVLGACSYGSEKEFRRPGDYFDDMVLAAMDDLQRQVTEAAEYICV